MHDLHTLHQPAQRLSCLHPHVIAHSSFQQLPYYPALACTLTATPQQASQHGMMFPMFKASFLGTQLEIPAGANAGNPAEQGGMAGDGNGTRERSSQPLMQARPPLLDLQALRHVDGPPSETQQRRAKFQFFDKHCSEVAENLFLSGDSVARNRELLQQHGISHVVNCVGYVCKEYFREELTYRTYFLQDTPAEDIVCVLYDAFEFMEQAFAKGGKVLVHCSQGVSRSATVVIAYLMWRTGLSYDEVYAQVKAKRGVANPNIGFTCQLLQWHKRRRAPPAKSRMYRIAPHCQHSPLLLVPRTVTPPKKYETHTWRQLDPRGAFVIQTPHKMYVWVGSQCAAGMAGAAQTNAQLLVKYEATGTQDLVVCKQGAEPHELLQLMDPPALDPDAEQQNARRASITGELYNSLNNAVSLNKDDKEDMDTEVQSLGSPMLSVHVDGNLQGAPSPHTPQSQPREAQTPDASTPVAAACTPFLHPSSAHHVIGSDSRARSTASPLPSFLVPSTMSTPMLAGPCNPNEDDRPSPAGSSWRITPTEEYSPDYQLYNDALRAATRSSTLGSNSSAGYNTDENSPLPLQLPLSSSRQLRVSVTGTERSLPSMQVPPSFLRFPGIAELEQGASPPGAGPTSQELLGSPYGPLIGRNEAPSGLPGETRMKKYRRGMTEELEDRLQKGEAGNGSGKLSRLFPGSTLHQSLDDEEMP